jgi:hypothetical protein
MPPIVPRRTLAPKRARTARIHDRRSPGPSKEVSMPAPEPDRRLTDAIQATVVYADLFDFALDCREVHRDMVGVAASRDKACLAVDALLRLGALTMVSGCVVLPGRGALAEQRRARRERAARTWPVARRVGRLIALIPFVRMVAVSGSLAADNPDARADLDYFIVTAPGRLWLVRAMTIVLVRLARGCGIRVCPNYLVTTRALALDHHDLFTAHELLQAVPLAGARTYRQLLASNEWAARWLPNRFQQEEHAVRDESGLPAAIGRGGEALLGGRIGDRLEAWEAGRKQPRFGGIDGTARFTADVCEGHFGHHRRRILREFQSRCRQLGIAVPALDLAGDVDRVDVRPAGPAVSRAAARSAGGEILVALGAAASEDL